MNMMMEMTAIHVMVALIIAFILILLPLTWVMARDLWDYEPLFAVFIIIAMAFFEFMLISLVICMLTP